MPRDTTVSTESRTYPPRFALTFYTLTSRLQLFARLGDCKPHQHLNWYVPSNAFERNCSSLRQLPLVKLTRLMPFELHPSRYLFDGAISGGMTDLITPLHISLYAIPYQVSLICQTRQINSCEFACLVRQLCF